MMPVRTQTAPDTTPFDVEIGRNDLAYFAKHFFPRHCRLQFSSLHDYLFKRRAAKIASAPPDRRGELDVIIAPRGAAKSTLMSLIFPIHALLYETDPYIVLFSATQRQASQRLANIRSMILDNAALAQAFPRLADKKIARASMHTLMVGDARMDAFSAGTEVRGINHGPWRPTWIILDDIERSDRVRSALHRDALNDWFDEIIANLGNGYTNVDLIGTLLHRDALPARLIDRADTSSKRFAAIESEAGNKDLWNEWRGLYHDLNNEKRIETARVFFNERRDEMLAGAKVLWPEKEDYYALCVLRERIGRRAFEKEKQNAPADEAAQLFKMSKIRKFRMDGDLIICEPVSWAIPGTPVDGAQPTIKLSDLLIGGFYDPALGTKGGDYPAIATIGIDSVGYQYVLDVWMEWVSPDEQCAAVFDFHAKYHYTWFMVETVGFQRMLLDKMEIERKRRRDRGDDWQLNLLESVPKDKKQSRIMRIQPTLNCGWLMFNESLSRLFYEQLEGYPTGRHDDGPDAVSGAFALLHDKCHCEVYTETVKRRESARVGSF